MVLNNDYDIENTSFHININHHNPTFRTILEILNDNYMVDFGIENSVASTLGFTNENLGIGAHVSPKVVNIEKVNSILIHCGFVLGSYVNEFRSNAIYTCSFTPRLSPGYKIIEYPRPEIIYIPMVQKPKLDQFRIWLTDQNNQPIDLMGETLSFEVLIRERK